jgi:membrane fusion protein
VPSRAIGFVRPGQEVRLLYDAFPYQRFGSFAARVETISRQAVAGQETNAPFKIDEPVYRVIVVPDRQQVNAYGQRVGLQPGMTLAANLVLERRSFLDWVLDPVRAVTNRT